MPTKQQKTLKGIVVSDRMAKTIVVAVKRFVKHPRYGKYLVRTKKYKAHDPAGRYHPGDAVTIRATRPISKDKHFEVL